VTNSSLLKESRIWNEEIVGELVQASFFLSEMLNNALDISKLDEGKIEFNKAYESIRSVIDFTLNVAKANADKKGIKVVPVYAANLPPLLEFDKSRLTQVIMNLVGNAIKFTPDKGKVTIKVNWISGEKPRLEQIIKRENEEEEKVAPFKLDEEPIANFKAIKRQIVKDKDKEKQNLLVPGPPDEITAELAEKVPDETSPDNSISPRKITGKIQSHLFITNFHKKLAMGRNKHNNSITDADNKPQPGSMSQRISKRSIDIEVRPLLSLDMKPVGSEKRSSADAKPSDASLKDTRQSKIKQGLL
jgi:hypothetical protein